MYIFICEHYVNIDTVIYIYYNILHIICDIHYITNYMERAKGIEPSSQAWEARILPMNYARITCLFYHSFTRISRVIGKSYSECVEKVT